jgi:hypothetical protein
MHPTGTRETAPAVPYGGAGKDIAGTEVPAADRGLAAVPCGPRAHLAAPAEGACR